MNEKHFEWATCNTLCGSCTAYCCLAADPNGVCYCWLSWKASRMLWPFFSVYTWHLLSPFHRLFCNTSHICILCLTLCRIYLLSANTFSLRCFFGHCFIPITERQIEVVPWLDLLIKSKWTACSKHQGSEEMWIQAYIKYFKAGKDNLQFWWRD